MINKLLSVYKILITKLHLRWVSHYSRVTGRPVPSGYSYALYHSIAQLQINVWDNVNTSGDIFLSSTYLTALEQAPPGNMGFRYSIISKDSIPVGIAYFQILDLNYRLHQTAEQQIPTAGKRSFFQEFHNKIIDSASLRLLVCGNVLVSGEHGFCMSSVPCEQSLHIIAEIAHEIRKCSNPRIMVTLIKDFYKHHEIPARTLSQFGYHSFDAGPNMVVPIRTSWPAFDDYLNTMKPKYRKRAVSAIKKGSVIRRQSLDLADLLLYKSELYDLYCQVVNKAKFKLYFLSPDFFIELKKNLANKFICEGYFLGSKIVGYTTRIVNDDIIEGYSHGVEYEHSKNFELYQNILLDDVRAAIESRSSVVNTGRTSIAMKSSIGAVPKEMVCYMRFSGGHSNHFIKPLFYFVKPSTEYCRNPFTD